MVSSERRNSDEIGTTNDLGNSPINMGDFLSCWFLEITSFNIAEKKTNSNLKDTKDIETDLRAVNSKNSVIFSSQSLQNEENDVIAKREAKSHRMIRKK
jgi:hypothetical protein